MLVSRLLALRTSLAALLARVWRRPSSRATPPAQGIYRAPPELPALPPDPAPPVAPKPKPKPPDPRRAPLLGALGSSTLAGAGIFAAATSPRAVDRFWGMVGVALFGTAAWLFWEQVAAGRGAPLEPAARRRTHGVGGLAGLLAITAAAHFEGMAPVPRLLALALGLLLALPGLVALWNAYRAQSEARAAPTVPRRRAADERRPVFPGASRTVSTRPPPAPDLRVQRRRWRRRG